MNKALSNWLFAGPKRSGAIHEWICTHHKQGMDDGSKNIISKPVPMISNAIMAYFLHAYLIDYSWSFVSVVFHDIIQRIIEGILSIKLPQVIAAFFPDVVKHLGNHQANTLSFIVLNIERSVSAAE